MRKTPLRPSRSPLSRRSPLPRVNRARKQTEFQRTYGSRARVKFVKSLPCSACGVRGLSENAHVCGPAGLGRKGAATTIAPLCGMYFGLAGASIGCHRLFDEYPAAFATRFPRFERVKAAADTAARWLAERGGGDE